MSSSYDRLLYAANKLRGWKSAADVARALSKAGHNTSDQMMTNWQSRGVSAKGCIVAATCIGCRADWIATGVGEMTEKTMTVKSDMKDTYEFITKEISELMEIMRLLDRERQSAVIGHAKFLLHEQEFMDSNAHKRTGN